MSIKNIVINMTATKINEVVGVLISEDYNEQNNTSTLKIRKTGSIADSLFNTYKLYNQSDGVNYQKISKFGKIIYIILQNNDGDIGLFKELNTFESKKSLELKKQLESAKGEINRLKSDLEKYKQDAKQEMAKEKHSLDRFGSNQTISNRLPRGYLDRDEVDYNEY